MTTEEADRLALEHSGRWLVLALALHGAALCSHSLVALAFCALIDVSALRHLAALYRSTTADLTVALVAVPATLARFALVDNPTDLSVLTRLLLMLAVNAAVAGGGAYLMKIQSRL